MLRESTVAISATNTRLYASAANQSRPQSFFSTTLSPVPFEGHHTVLPGILCAPRHGQAAARLRLSELRRQRLEMGWPMRRLRRVEHAGGVRRAGAAHAAG